MNFILRIALCFMLVSGALAELPDMSWAEPLDRLVCAELVDVELISSELEPDAGANVDMQNLVQDADNMLSTSAVQVFIRNTVPTPEFYRAKGWHVSGDPGYAEPDQLEEDESLLLQFTLGHDWRTKYTDVLAAIPEAICIIDSQVGEFNGPELQAFVEETHPREIVLGWNMANQIDNPDKLAELEANLRGCIEYAKRGNSEVFVWVTACAYVSGATNWFAMIDASQADGIALWNVHTMPVGWRGSRFLRQAFRHVRIYSNKPVVLAGLYGAKTWAITAEAAKEYQKDVFPAVYLEAEAAGFTAVWRIVAK